MPEVTEHRQVDIQLWKDGSWIRSNSYRMDSIGPWIEGLFEAFCGECNDRLPAEERSANDARIALLSHQLQHVQEELKAYRAAFFKLGREGSGRANGA